MVSILHFPARKRRVSLYERKFNEVRIKNYRLMQRIARTIDEYGAKCERLVLQDQIDEGSE